MQSLNCCLWITDSRLIRRYRINRNACSRGDQDYIALSFAEHSTWLLPLGSVTALCGWRLPMEVVHVILGRTATPLLDAGSWRWRGWKLGLKARQACSCHLPAYDKTNFSDPSLTPNTDVDCSYVDVCFRKCRSTSATCCTRTLHYQNEGLALLLCLCVYVGATSHP